MIHLLVVLIQRAFLGLDHMVLIVDDNSAVWPNHQDNYFLDWQTP